MTKPASTPGHEQPLVETRAMGAGHRRSLRACNIKVGSPTPLRTVGCACPFQLENRCLSRTVAG